MRQLPENWLKRLQNRPLNHGFIGSLRIGIEDFSHISALNQLRSCEFPRFTRVGIDLRSVKLLFRSKAGIERGRIAVAEFARM